MARSRYIYTLRGIPSDSPTILAESEYPLVAAFTVLYEAMAFAAQNHLNPFHFVLEAVQDGKTAEPRVPKEWERARQLWREAYPVTVGDKDGQTAEASQRDEAGVGSEECAHEQPQDFGGQDH